MQATCLVLYAKINHLFLMKGRFLQRYPVSKLDSMSYKYWAWHLKIPVSFRQPMDPLAAFYQCTFAQQIAGSLEIKKNYHFGVTFVCRGVLP